MEKSEKEGKKRVTQTPKQMINDTFKSKHS